MGLGGGGEEVLHGLFVGGQGALDQLINAGLELVTEASEITSGQNRLGIVLRKKIRGKIGIKIERIKTLNNEILLHKASLLYLQCY